MTKYGLAVCVLLSLLLGCASPAPSEADSANAGAKQSGADAKPADPAPGRFVGEYTVFAERDNGFIENPRYTRPVTIKKMGKAYVLSSEPGALLYRRPRTPGSDMLVPESRQGSAVVEIRFEQVQNHRVLIVSESFQTHYLVTGVGPQVMFSNRGLGQGEKPADAWSYQRKISHRGTRSERVIGELKLRGKPVEARRGDVIFTPIGKFMYFGKPDPMAYQSGWLYSINLNRALFKEDGSLTLTGAEYRANMKRPAYKKSYGPLPEAKLKAVADQIKPGMSAEQVRIALRVTFGDKGAIGASTASPLGSGPGRVEKIDFWTIDGRGRLTVRYHPLLLSNGTQRLVVQEAGVEPGVAE